MYMKRKQLATLSFMFLSLTFSTQFVIKSFFILKIMFLKNKNYAINTFY